MEARECPLHSLQSIVYDLRMEFPFDLYPEQHPRGVEFYCITDSLAHGSSGLQNHGTTGLLITVWDNAGSGTNQTLRCPPLALADPGYRGSGPQASCRKRDTPLSRLGLVAPPRLAHSAKPDEARVRRGAATDVRIGSAEHNEGGTPRRETPRSG